MASQDTSSHGSDGPRDAEPGTLVPGDDEQPGASSTQVDVEGKGPVTLADRGTPGGQASPDTNQGRTEPMPATPGQPDPNAPVEPPSLDEMNVGGADPQAPAHPAARVRDAPVAGVPDVRVDPGTAPHDDRPALDPTTSTGRAAGPERPAQAGPGTAQRQPGSLGVSPEQQETDVQAGGAQMRPGGGPTSQEAHVQPGDAQGVAVPHELPAEGTSQESPIVQGARTPAREGHAPGDQV